MKKALIAVLVIMTVFCASAFAKRGIENYSGLGVGYGLSRSVFTFNNPVGSVDRVWNSNQLVISFTDFGFFEKSPVGLFVDSSLAINAKRVTTFVGTEETWSDVPLGYMATIGPAFKFSMGKNVNFLLGTGFQLYTETNRINEYYSEEHTFFGLGLIAEAAYSLGKYFAVSFGASGSLYLAERGRYVYRYHEPDDISADKFLGYTVIPRIMAYFVY